MPGGAIKSHWPVCVSARRSHELRVSSCERPSGREKQSRALLALWCLAHESGVGEVSPNFSQTMTKLPKSVRP